MAQNRTSSINLKAKIGSSALSHNDRSQEKKPDYIFEELSKDNEVDISAKEAQNKINNLYHKATKDRQNLRTTDKKSSICEFVCVTDSHTTFQDLQDLSKHIEKEFGFTSIQVSHHKDEGHINKETKEMKINYHAHLTFFTLATEPKKDIKIGQQLMRREFLKPKSLRDLQTETAKILKMQRGEIGSKSKRLEHTEYRQIAEIREEFKSEKIQLLELKETIKKERKKLQNLGAKRADYAELEERHKQLQNDIKNKENISENLTQKIEKLEVKKKKIKTPDTDLQIEKIQNSAKQILEDNTNLVGKVDKDALVQDISQELNRAYNIKLISEEEEKAKKKIKKVKAENQEQKTVIIKFKELEKTLIDVVKKLGFKPIFGTFNLSFVTKIVKEVFTDYKEPIKQKQLEKQQSKKQRTLSRSRGGYEM